LGIAFKSCLNDLLDILLDGLEVMVTAYFNVSLTTPPDETPPDKAVAAAFLP
jgi:hypothetical protein